MSISNDHDVFAHVHISYAELKRQHQDFPSSTEASNYKREEPYTREVSCLEQFLIVLIMNLDLTPIDVSWIIWRAFSGLTIYIRRSGKRHPQFSSLPLLSCRRQRLGLF